MLRPPITLVTAVPAPKLPPPGRCRGGCSYELKFDGWRAAAFVDPTRVLLHSRNQRPLEGFFPDIAAVLADRLPAGTVLDGELVIYDPDRGRTWFPLLNRRVTAGRTLPAETARHPATYVVFDLLQDAGTDLTGRPYAQRRTRLQQLLADTPPALTVCPATVDLDVAVEWMTDAATVGVEGVVVKDLADPYRPGYTRWRKIRTRTTTEAVIGGATGPLTAPTGLLLGRYDDTGRLRYVARTSRLTARQSAELGALLPALRWPDATPHPWPRPMPAGWIGQFGPRQPTDYTPLEPVLVIEVTTDAAAEHGRHRHTVRLIRLRSDLDARDITTHALDDPI